MEYLYITVLLALNLVWLFLVVLGLPGTWLMVLSAAGLAWWQPELDLFSTWTLVAVAALAAIGEVLEFVSGALGSKKAGGSTWGALGGLAGAIAGGIFGTVLIPIPILGSILGACLGAFAGALGAEILAGRELAHSVQSGRGAAVGRFVGIVIKLSVGVAIYGTIAIAAFVA
jgi:uncharacterized protein YqgC (DUF456 family)